MDVDFSTDRSGIALGEVILSLTSTQARSVHCELNQKWTSPGLPYLDHLDTFIPSIDCKSYSGVMSTQRAGVSSVPHD